MIYIHDFDAAILLFIKNNMHSYLMDKTMIFMTRLGNGGLIWFVICILLILSKRYRRAGFTALTALVITTILGEGIIKHIVRRARPFTNIEDMKLLIARPISYSFPSGHTGASFAAATVLSKYFKKYSLFIFVLAVLIAFSRLYLYVHYPTDVLAGVILGIISGIMANSFVNKYVYKRKE
ncbi:phosphatase PAP2 family protein [Clostridium oryzae]|uniref:Undecaprenyl-diphosphatase BcrC n=1 Tax=Clostridium oryzae TaxID=1450648 RepID=A0A1V4IV80_9CLOT|nr:phosphatase PAP2 family protein [Clostridium oryzae]OPJ63846.1 undecaprenyl-diphosphatase BcrC [Clostridium oryzae]